MKLLANENIPMRMVHRLRDMGHDVLAVGETSPGIADAVVLDLACRQLRTLLTFDRDYGELMLERPNWIDRQAASAVHFPTA